MFGSSFVVLQFFKMKKWRRDNNTFSFEILFLCLADLFWTISHFSNHVDALAEGHVTDNDTACATMGFLTHLGIGWELMVIIFTSIHQVIFIFHATRKGKKYQPSKRSKIIGF